MRKRQFIFCTLILAGAALTHFHSAGAYSLLGNSLGVNNTGFQVHPASFTDSASNNNLTADINFPGATGAALAVWKGAAEWNSELRGGTGAGDPLHPGGLGGVASNFDFMYQGNVGSPGGNSSNTVFAGGFLGSGVYAVASSGTAGFSITFDNSPNNNWNWDDGPGNGTSSSKVDIQGIATHEFGHALGLGHSGDGGATMYPSTSTYNSVNIRSINTDDEAGIVAIYGAKSAAKPVVTGIGGNIYIGGTMTVTGSGFGAANEVWFTRDSSDIPGATPPQPLVATPISATSGSISVQVPPFALKGDIIIKSLAGASHEFKSAPFPLNLQNPPPGPWVDSVSPNPVAVAAPQTPVVTVTGVNLSSATSIKIGSRTWTAGQFTVQNNYSVTLPLIPPPDETGTLNVTVTTPSGVSTPKALVVNPASSDFLFVNTTSPMAGGNLTIYCATPGSGRYPLIGYSQCVVPLPIPPYVTYSIGGCGDIQFIEGTPITGSNGISSQTIGIPASFHGFALLQFASLNLANPFPMPVSNIVTVVVP